MDERYAVSKHHVRQEVCTTRPSYRDGRKSTAVKVYTVHQESRYLLIQNVPAVGAKEQLAKLLSSYGAITDLHPLDEYPADKFTEVYLVKFQRIQSARFAKKKLDDYSFFGGSLHICYAPEHESVNETREKLQDRRKVIAAKIRKLEKESEPSSASNRNRLALSSPSPSLPPPPLQAQLPPPPPPLTSPVSSVLSMSTQNAAHSTIIHPESHHHISLPEPSSSTRPQGFPVDSNNSHDTQEVGERGDVTNHDSIFHLPPPPIPGFSFDASQHRTPHVTKQNFDYAWVPSANSTFPSGYDPRLPQEDNEKTGEGVNVEIQNGSFIPSPNDKIPSEDTPVLVSSVSSASSSLTPVRHISLSRIKSDHSSRSNDKLIVRHYKPKGPLPKFVPRQIKNKTGTQFKSGSFSNLNLTKEEEVNHEIRREAFRLGEDQGPSLPTDPETREQLLGQRPLVEPSVESSVVSSVKAIRKRMSKFISETVPKKLRTSDIGNKMDNKHKDSDSRDQ